MTTGMEPEFECMSFDSKSYVLSMSTSALWDPFQSVDSAICQCYLVNLSKLLTFSVC